MIWEDVLSGCHWNIGDGFWTLRKDRQVVPSETIKNMFSLPQVCRQLYAETAFLPSKLGSFTANCKRPADMTATLKAWLDKAPSFYQDQISDISFGIGRPPALLHESSGMDKDLEDYEQWYMSPPDLHHYPRVRHVTLSFSFPQFNLPNKTAEERHVIADTFDATLKGLRANMEQQNPRLRVDVRVNDALLQR